MTGTEAEQNRFVAFFFLSDIIYTETDDPTNGELAESFTVEVPRTGYHTIELPEAVMLEHGCVFSVVLNMSVDTGSIDIAMEVGDDCTSTEGQSFCLKYGKWYKNEEYYSSRSAKNYYIQAFTNTVCTHPNRETVTAVYDDCYNQGYERIVCTDCNDIISEILLPKKAHTPGEWIIEKAASCTVAGIQTKKCTECSQIVETQDIPATGHSPGDWEVIIATNCWREGTLAILCQTCGVTLESQKIPKVEHDYIYSVVTDPTCEKSGVGKYTCSMCREYYEVNIEPTGEHIYSEWMLIKDSLGATRYMAADCNHDGVMDTVDIKLLRDAGMLLASVDQTQTAQVLFESSSVYAEYLDVIDQSPMADDTKQEKVENSSETETEKTETFFDLLDIIIELMAVLWDMFIRIW